MAIFQFIGDTVTDAKIAALIAVGPSSVIDISMVSKVIAVFVDHKRQTKKCHASVNLVYDRKP